MNVRLALPFFFLMVLAGAGTSASIPFRGSEVVLCEGQTPRLYDVYEAKILRNIDLDLGPATVSIPDKVKSALEPIAKLDPARSALYQNWANSFFAETDIGDYEVAADYDSDHIALPRGCKLQPLINQRPPQFSGDRRYFIDKILWQTLDNDQKAAAILHEVIYHEFLKLGARQPGRPGDIRYFNSLLFSRTLTRMTDDEYVKFVFDIQLNNDFVPFHGITYTSFDRTYQIRAGFDEMRAVQGYPLTSLDGAGPLPQVYKTSVAGQDLEIELKGAVDFYENNSLQTAIPDAATTREWHAYGKTFKLSDRGAIWFFHTGAVEELPFDGEVSFRVQGQDITFVGTPLPPPHDPRSYFLRFAPNGAPIVGVIGPRSLWLRNAKGLPVLVHGGSQIELDPSGHLLSVYRQK